MKNLMFFVALCAFGINAYAITPEEEYNLICLEEMEEKSLFNNDVDPIEIHYIAAINGDVLELTDGTQIDTGFFWRKRFQTWQPGDVVRISYTRYKIYYGLKIENITQDSRVWGHTLIKFPDVEKADARWLVSIDKDSIELNDGTRFNITSKLDLSVYGWNAGDAILIMSNNDPQYVYMEIGYPYWLWNARKGNIVGFNKLP